MSPMCLKREYMVLKMRYELRKLLLHKQSHNINGGLLENI